MPKIKAQPPIEGAYVIPKSGFTTWESRVATTTPEGETYEQGYFLFREGTVEAYSQGGARFKPSTRLTAYYQGKIYSRHFNHRYSQRYLKTLARQLMDDVVKRAMPIYHLEIPPLPELDEQSKQRVLELFNNNRDLFFMPKGAAR